MQMDLKKVLEKKVDSNQVLEKVNKYIYNTINKNKDIKFDVNFEKNKEKEVIGICPRCKKGKIFESSKVFYCENFKSNPKCEFVMWKENKFFSSKGKKLSKAIAKKLLKDGKAHVRGLRKKDNS